MKPERGSLVPYHGKRRHHSIAVGVMARTVTVRRRAGVTERNGIGARRTSRSALRPSAQASGVSYSASPVHSFTGSTLGVKIAATNPSITVTTRSSMCHKSESG